MIGFLLKRMAFPFSIGIFISHSRPCSKLEIDTDKFSWKDIRHTTGALLHLKSADPLAIKDQLRLTTIETTDNFYIGSDIESQRSQIQRLPLLEVAQDCGISVQAIPGNYLYLGYFSPERSEIFLATKEESAFFHELAHAAHERILGGLKKGQDWKQEIVAELSAAVICQLVGKTSKYLGNSYQYIANYAKEAELTPIQGCLRVMKDAESVLNLILKRESTDTEE